MSRKPLYLDYNSTTPMRPQVFEAMKPWLTTEYGNPSSTHQAGQQARKAVETARERLARLLGARPLEILFSSGGTESVNLALKGTVAAKNGLQVATTEHHCVLRSAEAMARSGVKLKYLEVDGQGQLRQNPEGPGLVSVMHVNNETGVIHPVGSIAKVSHENKSIYHCDTVQSFGKIKINVKELGLDLMSVAAHKFGGPKGVGFLYKSDGIDLFPQMTGGEQEQGLRAGTENVAGIVGMAVAAELAMAELASESARLKALRDHFEAELLRKVPEIRINGALGPRIHNTSSFLLPGGVESDLMIMRLDAEGILVSAGSACAAGAIEPSHVLKAMGVPDDLAKCGLRVSFGWASQDSDGDVLVAALVSALRDLGKAAV
ncbi:MAG: cysteine desulfurase family protein [candidate division FCPU426 bacterium]